MKLNIAGSRKYFGQPRVGLNISRENWEFDGEMKAVFKGRLRVPLPTPEIVKNFFYESVSQSVSCIPT